MNHAIKPIDRLLGNNNLHREKDSIYKWHASFIARANPFPVVLVDWSDIREQLRYMTLRASVSVKGRAVTLYEQAFEYKNYNSPKSHQHFLDKLQSLLPKDCTPIIVSDAGFRNTWFRQVANKGWFWLGRVRGEVSVKLPEKDWCWNKTLYPAANSKVRYLGECKLAKRSPLKCSTYLYKSQRKGRKAHRHSHTCQKHSAGKVFNKGALAAHAANRMLLPIDRRKAHMCYAAVTRTSMLAFCTLHLYLFYQ